MAPEIGDPTSIPVTAATLGAMGECPSGALRWHEDAPEERDR